MQGLNQILYMFCRSDRTSEIIVNIVLLFGCYMISRRKRKLLFVNDLFEVLQMYRHMVWEENFIYCCVVQAAT